MNWSRGGTRNISRSEKQRICDSHFVTSFTTEQERSEDRAEVEQLYDACFGGNIRWQRPVYELRKGYSPVAALCHVVRQHEQQAGKEAQEAQEEEEHAHKARVVAALRFWEVRIKASAKARLSASAASKKQHASLAATQTEKRALLFGPLAVNVDVQGKGLGKALVEHNIALSKRLGYGGILISGVAAYYRPFGFRTLCVAGLRMPKPSPGHVLMGLELKPHFLLSAEGEVLPECRNALR